MKDKKEKKDEKKKEKRKLTPEEKETLKELEEELIAALEEDEDVNDNPLLVFFNMSLHKNFFIHTLLFLITNILSLMAVIGITGLGKVTNMGYFFAGIVLFSFVEMILKITFVSFFTKIVVKSFGLVNLLYITPIYYFIVVVLGKIEFVYFWHNIIIFVSFLILRLFLTYYIKKINFRR